jgi:hypothetical protein
LRRVHRTSSVPDLRRLHNRRQDRSLKISSRFRGRQKYSLGLLPRRGILHIIRARWSFSRSQNDTLISESSLTDLVLRIGMLVISHICIIVIYVQLQELFEPLFLDCLFDAWVIFSSAVRSIAEYISKGRQCVYAIPRSRLRNRRKGSLGITSPVYILSPMIFDSIRRSGATSTIGSRCVSGRSRW